MRSLSLRTRMLVLVLVILIPLIGLQIFNMHSRFEEAYEQELAASQEYVEAIETSFLNYLDSIWEWEHAVGVAITSEGQNFSTHQINQYFDRILKNNSDLEDIVWILPDGEVAAATHPAIVEMNLGYLPHFQQVKSGQRKVVSNVLHDPDIQAKVIFVARGIYDSADRLEGVLATSFRVTGLQAVLPKKRSDSKSSFGLIDQEAQLVYRHNTHAPENYVLAEDSPGRLALQGKTVVTRHFISSVTNDERLGVISPLGDLGWATFVTANRAEVLATAKRGAIHDIFVILMVIAIALVIISVFHKQFLQPIQQLQHAAMEIAASNLHARADIRGKDELAMTGLIFDEMARRVQEVEENRLHFLHTAAHELRNPMAGVKGLLALLIRKIEAGKPLPNLPDKLKIMEKEIDRLSRLLNEILDAFRLQQEKTAFQYQFKSLDMDQVIESSLECFRIAYSQWPITYQNQLSSTTYLEGDAKRLEEVVYNLVENAIKFSPQGGEIRVKLEREGNSLVLSVQDQGTGIPEDKLNSIFGCFARLNTDHLQDQGGMGLGLFISREIVKKHKGEIWVESDGQIGSTFYLRLPIYRNV